jgi:hypothetical protein
MSLRFEARTGNLEPGSNNDASHFAWPPPSLPPSTWRAGGLDERVPERPTVSVDPVSPPEECGNRPALLIPTGLLPLRAPFFRMNDRPIC